MDWKEVGKKLLQIGAPVLGTALGGPAGGIAAKAAISMIGAKFGIEEELVTPNTVMELVTNPEQVIKLKEIELNHAYKLEELIIDDRKNVMEAETQRHANELGTKTIPWVDALHKLGRQILNIITIIAVMILMLNGKTITPEVTLLLGGGNVAYQLIKGKGKQ